MSNYDKAKAALQAILLIAAVSVAFLVYVEVRSRQRPTLNPELAKCHHHRHNGLWGDGCGRFTTPGHHGAGGVRG